MKSYHIAIALSLLLCSQQHSFAAWDGKTATYKWLVNADSLTGETAEKPYILSTESDLAGLANLISGTVAGSSPHPNAFDGKYFSLANDLDFANPKGTKNIWKPIGDKKHPFRGNFLGNGHIIKNLVIGDGCEEKNNVTIDVYSETSKASTEDLTDKFADNECNDIGLFGNLMYAKIKDVTLKNVTINGNYIIGGICGHASFNATVSNCHVEGNIKGNGFIGGICGFMETDCVIDSCTMRGTLTSTHAKLAAGGICGIAQSKCVIQNCENYSKIICDESEYVGGICGLANLFCNISKCANGGDINVTASKSGVLAGFGGICGVLGHACNITETINIGSITVNTDRGFAGGTCGMGSEETSITFCYNAGNISTSSGCVGGGICGMSYRNNINSNINVGYLEGSGSHGAIIGYNFKDRSFVSKCYFDMQMCPLEYGNGITEAGSPKGTNRGTDRFSTIAMTGILSGLSTTSGKWMFGEGTYPTLRSMAESEISKMGVQPIILQEGETADSTLTSFQVATTNGIDWKVESGAATLAEGKGEMPENSKAKLCLSNGSLKRTVTLKSKAKVEKVNE